MPTYYFAIASQKFLLREEPLEEVLRERTKYYKSINKQVDFWLVKNPAFIYSSESIDLKKYLQEPSAAIISYNSKFINWIKLRLGFVLVGTLNIRSISQLDN